MATPKPRLDLVVYVLILGLVLLGSLLKVSSSDRVSIADVAAANPAIISPFGLLVLRSLMLAINLWATILKLKKTENKTVIHMPQTALKSEMRIFIHGPMWCTFFTVWSWLLQMLFLAGAAACSAISVYGLDVDVGWKLPTALWMAYEVSFACAVLISFIVKYVLIPGQLAKGLAVNNFFETQELLMHNCNTLFMAAELACNELPFHLHHFPIAALWGLLYVLFSWVWLAARGVCWYDFLDPTLPFAIKMHTALIAVLAAFFAIGAGFAAGAASIASPYIRVPLMLAGVAMVAKTGFITGVPQLPTEKTK